MDKNLIELIERELGEYKRVQEINEDVMFWDWGLNAGRIEDPDFNTANKMHSNKMFYRKNWKDMGFIDLLGVMQDDLRDRVLVAVAVAAGTKAEEGCPVEIHQRIVTARAEADNTVVNMLKGCVHAPGRLLRLSREMSALWDKKSMALAAKNRPN